MSPAIAIIGLACEFPGASSPRQLWQTALHCWRWFRDLPPQRLDAAYHDALGERPDTTRTRRAALLDGYVFPRERFALGENDLRAADFSHWLALDCAERALRDSGLDQTLPRDATRVIVGNSLTGESSRAELLRLRWPYVRKTLEESGCSGTDEDWTRREHAFKARLTAIDGRTLAGALSNVIAGRIAHHFDLRGGCYCVDAACASSLAAVAQACSQLAAGEIECALVGGVDVSLDPLELVGFSVAGALSQGEMRVFDQRRDGLLPGEGCGFAVLMRADHTALEGRKVRAFIRGWALSSDGRHDLTAPSPAGQAIALRRAYAMAGFGIETVPLFEAHGTGTPIGDEVELGTLTTLLEELPAAPLPAAVGSIKANIGHTKAAAGMAGLIKAVMALQEGVLPPSPPAPRPMPEVSLSGSRLRLLDKAESWPQELPRRAGVSGFGFGGVNAHIVLEAEVPAAVAPPTSKPCCQEVEIFVFDGIDREDLHRRIAKVHTYAAHLANVELPAAARACAAALRGRPWRAAVIAKSAGELAALLADLLADGKDTARSYTGTADGPPRIGFLFPGQGGNSDVGSGYLCSRFGANLGTTKDAAGMQAGLVAGSIKATALLAEFGIRPQLCLGHSLGEISALSAAGFLAPEDAVDLARNRGRVMDECREALSGRMEVIHGGEAEVQKLINGHPVAIAALNSATQIVVAGRGEAVAALVADAAKAKLATAELSSGIAFHSPLMAAVAEPFAECLEQTEFTVPRAALYSTVTGRRFDSRTSPVEHLVAQLTSPVRCHEAFAEASKEAGLWIEVGAGCVLAGLAAPTPVLSLQTEKPALAALLRVLAAAYVNGAELNWAPLYDDRSLPDFDPDWVPRFFVNPCERTLLAESSARGLVTRAPQPATAPLGTASPLAAVRAALAERKGEGISAETIREGDTLGHLGVDSIGLLKLQRDVEERVGYPASGRTYKEMTVEEFAALFTGRSEASVESLSDRLEPWSGILEIRWHQVELGLEGRSPVGEVAQPLLIEGEAPLDSILAVLREPSTAPVVFLDGDERLPGFAKSFALEHPERKVLFLHHELGLSPAMERIMRELAEDFTFRELRYDAAGIRHVPLWQRMETTGRTSGPILTREDVVFVSGGAKGITAECLLAIAGDSGARFAIAGRSAADDPQVGATLGALDETGIAYRYAALDLGDAIAVANFVAEVTSELGPVTAIIHGAGIHLPCVIRELTAADINSHCHAKVDGLKNLLDQVSCSSLKRLVTFGSVIARSGYARSAAYAFANDAMARLLASYAAEHPGILCQTLDWSAWGETGMGVDLQAIAPLKAAGVDPLRNVDGRSLFLEALRSEHRRPVLTGRLPSMPTMGFAAPPVPEIPGIKVLSYSPGLELVVEVPLSTAAYPWLAGHALDGNVILPGMLAIELIRRVAESFTESPLHDIRFTRRVTLPSGGALVLHIQVLYNSKREIICRLSEADHSLRDPAVAATFGGTPAGEPDSTATATPIPTLAAEEGTAIARDLYARLVFHRDDFQRVSRYTHATAKEVAFELSAPPPATDSLAAGVLLRDAIVHGIQACIPGELLLPASIAHIRRFSQAPPRHITARETAAAEDSFTYEVIARDAHGRITEQWQSLTLRRYRHHTVTAGHHSALQAIHRERGGTLAAGSAAATPTPIAAAAPASAAHAKRYYEYRHIVGFKETNIVGNVYFTNHIEWQGRCREMFLRDHVPEVLGDIEAGRLALVTVSCSCEYEEEVHAFSEISVRMTLAAHGGGWAEMQFEYWNPATATRIATGRQRIACKNCGGGGRVLGILPAALLRSLQSFAP